MPDFESDPHKESRNLVKHHISFTTASLIWDGLVLERPDNRRDYGESRFVAIDVVDARTLAVVFTWRGEARRIISARIANTRENRYFQEEIRRRQRSPPD